MITNVLKQISRNSDNEVFTVIVTMNDIKKDYKVFGGREETEYDYPDNGIIKIKSNGSKKIQQIRN